MNVNSRSRKIKIGYMPLAHDVYWRFFPEYEATAYKLADICREYLKQFGTICETGLLIDSPARSHQARLLFQAEDVDVLVLVTITYSTPDDVILDLLRFPRPTVVWNTQASARIPDNMDFPAWMWEHGVTGVPGITNLLERKKKPYFLISGHLENSGVRESFLTVFTAVNAFKNVWGSRIGMIGHLYPGMIDFGYDPTSMYTTFGVSTDPIQESVTLSAFDNVDEEEGLVLARNLGQEYLMAKDFEGEEFVRSMRLARALERVVQEHELDAITVYCQSLWQKPEIGVVPCLGMSLLMQNGIFCSCEGDVPTALSGMMLEHLTGNQALFTEIWCNDFENDQFMLGHSGTMNLGLFEENGQSVRMVRHPWWNGCHGRGACLEVHMPAGRATLMCLSPMQGSNWRMIVSRGEVTERNPVPLGAPNFFFKMDKPITTFLEELASAGAAHHYAMAYGDWTKHLKALATLFSIEYYYI